MKFSFEDLAVWQIAVDFTEKVYLLTQGFPKEEIYGVTNQLRRASLSISLNIAEGKGRFSNKEFKQFLFLARGSLYEVITLLKLCVRLKYLSESEYKGLLQDCETMQSKLAGLLNYLKTKVKG